MAAYGLNTSRFKHVNWIWMLLLTPMVVPVILIGIGVFYAYVKLKLVNTLLGLVLAHCMLAIPVVMLVVGSALKS
jgi:putative spermidine/putrescine transport system permease protein